MIDDMAVYIANLGKYNEGYLYCLLFGQSLVQ
jgi:hypothetical protein